MATDEQQRDSMRGWARRSGIDRHLLGDLARLGEVEVERAGRRLEVSRRELERLLGAGTLARLEEIVARVQQ